MQPTDLSAPRRTDNPTSDGGSLLANLAVLVLFGGVLLTVAAPQLMAGLGLGIAGTLLAPPAMSGVRRVRARLADRRSPDRRTATRPPASE